MALPVYARRTEAVLGEQKHLLGEQNPCSAYRGKSGRNWAIPGGSDETRADLGETRADLGETRADLGETRADLALLSQFRADLGEIRASLALLSHKNSPFHRSSAEFHSFLSGAPLYITLAIFCTLLGLSDHRDQVSTRHKHFSAIARLV